MMNDDRAITIRCRVLGCGFQWTPMTERPMRVLRILEQEGWWFVQQGRKSRPACPKPISSHSPYTSQIREIGKTPAISPHLRAGESEGRVQMIINIY
jgi:hypothetical protein